MTMLIAISGKKQSGKNTLMNSLKPILSGYGDVGFYAFADDLKSFLVDSMGLRPEQVWGSDEDKNSLTHYSWDSLPYEIRKSNTHPESNDLRSGLMTARELMQIFGTDIMRQYFDDSIWVNSCMNRIKKDNKSFAIVSDMRFHSELNVWLKNQGIVVRLGRSVDSLDGHKSENDLDDVNWETYNNCIYVPANLNIKEVHSFVSSWLIPLVEQNQ